MAIDFGKPTTTRRYDTEFVPDLQGNFAGLAQWLDSAQTTVTAPPTYAKRYNRVSTLFEEFNGSAWAELPVGYARKAGDTFSGAVNVALELKATRMIRATGWWGTTGGSYDGLGVEIGQNAGDGYMLSYNRSTSTYGQLRLAASNVFFEPQGGNVYVPGANLNIGYGTDQGYRLAVNGQILAAGQVRVAGVSEAVRLAHDYAYISFYNTAGTTRSGYVAFNAGSSNVVLMQELNASIVFGTNNTTRALLDQNGHFRPFTDSTYALGASGTRWSNVYSVAADFSGRVGIGGGIDAASAGIAFGVSYTDNINGAPWYGVGRTSTDLFTTGSSQVQVAGYYGLRLRSSGVTLDLYDTSLRFTGAYAQFNSKAFTTVQTINGGTFTATPTVDANLSNVFLMPTLTGNITSMTIINPTEGQFLSIRFKQDATGGRTVTTGNMGINSAPAIGGSINTAANKVSYLNLTYNSADSRWEGSWTALP